MKDNKFLAIGAFAVFATLMMVEPAWAQAGSNVDGSWVDPIVNLFKSIQSGLGQLGAIVVGLGVMVLGLWAGLSGRLDWNRAIWIVLGGMLVVAGPQISESLLGTAA